MFNFVSKGFKSKYLTRRPRSTGAPSSRSPWPHPIIRIIQLSKAIPIHMLPTPSGLQRSALIIALLICSPWQRDISRWLLLLLRLTHVKGNVWPLRRRRTGNGWQRSMVTELSWRRQQSRLVKRVGAIQSAGAIGMDQVGELVGELSGWCGWNDQSCWIQRLILLVC